VINFFLLLLRFSFFIFDGIQSKSFAADVNMTEEVELPLNDNTASVHRHALYNLPVEILATISSFLGHKSLEIYFLKKSNRFLNQLYSAWSTVKIGKNIDIASTERYHLSAIVDELPLKHPAHVHQITLCEIAIKNNRLDDLKLLHSIYGSLSHELYYKVVYYGNIEMMQYLRYDCQCTFPEDLMNCAAGAGNIPMASWLRQNKCTMGTTPNGAFYDAAESQCVEMMHWLYDQQLNLEDDVINFAVQYSVR
jgi:hypothetical protein